MNGAEKIVNAMKKVNQSNQQVPSQIISATIVSVEPLIFQLENRLKIDSNFYELSGLTDWTKVQVGDVFKGFSFNEGQKYFILDAIAAASTSGNSSSVINQLQESIAQAKGITIPIGGGCDYFGANEPENFKFANGQALKISDFPELYAVIGESYRKEDNLDLTTFNLPDKRTRTGVMIDVNDTTFNELGKEVGEKTHVLTESELPSVKGSVSLISNVVTNAANTRMFYNASGKFSIGTLTDSTSTSVNATIGTGRYNNQLNMSFGSGNASNNTQLSLVCNYIIRVK